MVFTKACYILGMVWFYSLGSWKGVMALPVLVVVDEIITNGEVYLNHYVNNAAWTYCRTEMRK